MQVETDAIYEVTSNLKLGYFKICSQIDNSIPLDLAHNYKFFFIV